MALKIRLRQQGRKNFLVYRLVLSDSRSPRDGKYTEFLGWYNPHEETETKNVMIKSGRVLYWLQKGAILTDKAKNLVARGAPEVFNEMRRREEEKRIKKRQQRKVVRSQKVSPA
ncbi:MAG: 30S ribosomal protein S16 [Chlamydiales bacterium]